MSAFQNQLTKTTRALKCKPSAGDMIVEKPVEWYNAVHVVMYDWAV